MKETINTITYSKNAKDELIRVNGQAQIESITFNSGLTVTRNGRSFDFSTGSFFNVLPGQTKHLEEIISLVPGETLKDYQGKGLENFFIA